MYLKRSRRKKNGADYESWSLVESVRTSMGPLWLKYEFKPRRTQRTRRKKFKKNSVTSVLSVVKKRFKTTGDTGFTGIIEEMGIQYRKEAFRFF